jgi:enhancing lycopene biosynthesis protein 2
MARGEIRLILAARSPTVSAWIAPGKFAARKPLTKKYE